MRVCLLFVLLVLSSIGRAEITDERLLQPSPDKQWFTVNTELFSTHFQNQHKDYALRLSALAQEQAEQLFDDLQWKPKSKTHLVVNDSVDISNGAATIYPYNQFFVYMTEPTNGVLKDHLDFLQTLFTHEFTHVLHLDQVAGIPASLRKVFGKSESLFGILGMPQVMAPRWLSEGIAVFNESKSGYGRLNGAIYHSQIREELEKGLSSYTQSSYDSVDNSRWPNGKEYLYGAFFFDFLNDKYGQEVIDNYINTYSDHLIPWRMHKRARKVTGKDNEQLWKEYQQYLKESAGESIRKIKAKGLTDQVIVYDKPQRNTMLSKGPDGSIFFYHKGEHQQGKIIQLFDDGKELEILTVKGLGFIQWHPHSGLLISKTGVCDNTKLYSDLYQYNLEQKKLVQLTHCRRIVRGDWAADGASIYGVQNKSGKNHLLQIGLDGKTKRLASLKLGEAIGQPDSSSDGELLIASVKRQETGWGLEVFDLNTRQWTALSEDHHIPSFPVFSDDAKKVYFVAGDGSQQELSVLDLATGQVDVITNSIGYIHQAIQRPDQKFVVSQYTGEGDVIAQLNNISTVYQRYNLIDVAKKRITFAASNPTINELDIQPYAPWRSMHPRGWSPVMGVTEDLSIYGIAMAGSDVLGFHQWHFAPTLTTAYDYDLFTGNLSYTYHSRFSLFASRSGSLALWNSENEFTEGYVIEDRLQALVTHPINHIDWSLNLRAGLAYIGNDYKDQSNLSLNKSDERMLGVGLSYNNRSPIDSKIALAEGFSIDLSIDTLIEDSSSREHTGTAAILKMSNNWQFTNHQAIRLSANLGVTDPEGLHFQLGGDLPESNDYGGISQVGERIFSLRGYSNHRDLTGKAFVKGNLAWYLPLRNSYDGFSAIPIGLGRVNSNLFVETGDAWSNNEDSKLYSSVGVELQTELLIGYDNVLLPIAFGLVHGVDEELGETRGYLRVVIDL